MAVAVCFIAASSAEAARVGNTAWWRNGAGYWWAAGPGYKVKFCKNPNGTGSCVSTTTYAETGSNSSYYVDLPYSTSDQVYYFFLWNDTWAIGSEWTPSWNQAGGTSILIPGGWTSYISMSLNTGLRPLKPTAVYPTNGSGTVPTSFTLKWTSGINSDRVGWAATYDVYAYGEGATSEVLVASNVSCNPDGSGNCQLAISNIVPNALYHWRVVAKLNIGAYAPDPYYVNSSDSFTFTTAVDSNAPTTFMTSNLSNYLTAAGCGGGLMDATGTSNGTCQRFKVEDVNGGNINSGDVVHLNLGSYYAAAENAGGGNVSVQYTSAVTWEKFTVTKISGAPGSRIVNGDRISFKTYDGSHYVKATNNGGSTVNATSTSVGTNETFIYETDMN